MTDELTPPTGLTPPEPVKHVEQDGADKMIRLEPVMMEKLDEKVREFTEIVVTSDVQSDLFKERVNTIHSMGNKEIRALGERVEPHARTACQSHGEQLVRQWLANIKIIGGFA